MTSRSYRMNTDSGHAPCAFDSLRDLARVTPKNCIQIGSKVLSLSTCAKNVRAIVQEGNYVLGISSNDFGEKANCLVWAGKVSRIIQKSEYFQKFPGRPDNYYKSVREKYIQTQNPFHGEGDLHSDLNPPNVLLFEDEWWYFGSSLKERVPQGLMAQRQEAKILDEALTASFIGSIAWKYPRNQVLDMPNHLNRGWLYDYMVEYYCSKETPKKKTKRC